MKTAEEHIRHVVETSYISGTVSTVKVISRRFPMEETQENLALFAYIRDISKKYGLGDLQHCVAGGGSDSCYTQAAGIPSICGLGASGRFQHTAKEYLNPETVALRAKILCAFLLDHR